MPLLPAAKLGLIEAGVVALLDDLAAVDDQAPHAHAAVSQTE